MQEVNCWTILQLARREKTRLEKIRHIQSVLAEYSYKSTYLLIYM